MSETITVTLIPDEDGYVGRECPVCEGYFKVLPGTGLTDQDTAYCPYCGEQHDASDFATKEQLSYATSVALQQVHQQLAGTLKHLETTHAAGPLGVRITASLTGDDPPIELYQEARLETAVVCSSCTLQYKVYGVFATCPDCGMHNSDTILVTNMDVLRRQLAAADEHQLENILQNSVGVFDAVGRSITERELGTKISFQNLNGVETNLQAHQRSLRAHVTREEWEFLTRAFQKRHLLTHNLGVIDEQYLQRANDSDAIIGRKVRLTATEVERVIDLIQRLASTLTATVTAPPPAPSPGRQPKNPYQLSSDARALANLVYAKDGDGMGQHTTNEEDAAAELGLSDLHFDAALRELVDYRLIDQDGRWLASTPRMPLALPDQITYSPTADDEIVAKTLVATNERCAGRDLVERTELPVERVNRAVARLAANGALELQKAIGTAPYRFYSVHATGETIRYLRKFD